MAIRRRQVHPDEILTLRGGAQMQVVSDEAFLGQLLEVGRMVCFAGGVVTATVMRAETDLPGERVTVGAVVEWKDRTDAREQPEPATAPQLVEQPEEHADDLDREEPGKLYMPEPYPEIEKQRGSAALPFQREEEPVDADAALAQVDAALGGAPAEPEPEIAREHQIEPRVELQEAIVHEEGGAYKPVRVPAGVPDSEVHDGLQVVDFDAVDESEIPEHLR